MGNELSKNEIKKEKTADTEMEVNQVDIEQEKAREEFLMEMKTWNLDDDCIDILSDDEEEPATPPSSPVPLNSPESDAEVAAPLVDLFDEDLISDDDKADTLDNAQNAIVPPEREEPSTSAVLTHIQEEHKNLEQVNSTFCSANDNIKKLFEEVCEKCLAVDIANEMKPVLDGLAKKVHKVAELETDSKRLQDLLINVLEKVTESPNLAYCHLNNLYDQLALFKRNATQSSSVKTEHQTPAKKRKLFKTSQSAEQDDKIQDLRNGLLMLVNSEYDESDYAIKSKRICQIYGTIQARSHSRKFKYKGTDFEQFNAYVSRLVNVYDGFCDYNTILERLRTLNVDHQYGLTHQQCAHLATKTCSEIPVERKKLRGQIAKEKYKLLYDVKDPDPARDDADLLEKLSANDVQADTRMNLALTNFMNSVKVNEATSSQR